MALISGVPAEPGGPVPGDGISARGVSRSFGAVRAVEHVDFHAPAGKVTALMGPNGAGKTTLPRAAAAAQPARALVHNPSGSEDPAVLAAKLAELGMPFRIEDGRRSGVVLVLNNDGDAERPSHAPTAWSSRRTLGRNYRRGRLGWGFSWCCPPC